MSRHVLVRPT